MTHEVEHKGKKYEVKFRHIRDFKLTGQELYTKLHDHFESCDELTKTDLADIMSLISRKNINPMGGQTQAYIELSDGETIVGVAECSVNDVYSKKIGRQISLGRLNKILSD